jgi:hypothetical protein
MTLPAIENAQESAYSDKASQFRINDLRISAECRDIQKFDNIIKFRIDPGFSQQLPTPTKAASRKAVVVLSKLRWT